MNRNTSTEYRIELFNLNTRKTVATEEFKTKDTALTYGRDLAAGMSYTRNISWRGNIAKNGMRSSDDQFLITVNRAINGRFY